MDGVRWLTYDEVAAALGIGSESARVLVRRKRWPRRAGNDGKARIGIPEDTIAARTGSPTDRANSPPNDPPNSPPSDRPNDPPSDRGNEPDQLTELRVLNARLEVRIEALQAVVEAEQVRAARERQLLEKAIEEARAERDRWAGQAEQVVATVDPLKSTIEALKAALDAERGRLSEFREERDRWRTAATARRSWWPWRRSA
jgi:hypothetical protein